MISIFNLGYQVNGQTILSGVELEFRRGETFGLGLDVPLSSHFLLGVNVWDNHSPNISLSSAWEIAPQWSLSLEEEFNVKAEDNTWNLELWRNF